MNHEVIELVCPYCGRVIRSLYQAQAEFNFESHKLSCKKRPLE